MTKEQIQECCFDYSTLPYKIKETFGEGIIGKEYYTDKADRPREVILEITSFRGIAWNAVHYYGKVKVYHPPIKKEGSNSHYGGYLGEDTPLFKDINIEIELYRYVTDKEHKKDPLHYNEDMRVTNGWLNKDSLVKFAKEVFKERFVGEWKLTIKDLT